MKLPSPPCAVPLVLTVACEFTSIILSVYLELLKTARSRWSQEGYIRLIRHEEEDSYCGWDNTPSHGSLCADENVTQTLGRQHVGLEDVGNCVWGFGFLSMIQRVEIKKD